ncbi:MAG TPA: fatty acid desaturase [Steroidobacteraceae bacterium]|nr:fatty acid desaturase [Steroidobacteraceae bacterium]
MSQTPAAVRIAFRDRAGAGANAVALAWTAAAFLGAFALMAAHQAVLAVLGVLLCVHAMVLAAYLVHEAAHQSLYASHAANRRVGELMSFIAGAAYASFERIRHMHIRHHLDRADLACFDLKGLLGRHAFVRRLLEILEWAYVPATEILMHLQVIWRPFWVRSQRRYLPRAAAMLVLRATLLAALGWWSLQALVLYFVAVVLQLHVLNFFDAFHHTFEQYFVAADEPVPMLGRTRNYEQENTYSNLLSRRYPWLNALVLNFGYHNAHHERASVPWHRLPTFHRHLYGAEASSVMPLRELLGTWHRNRVRRVSCAEYGMAGHARVRADSFIGAHGVSFLTVV